MCKFMKVVKGLSSAVLLTLLLGSASAVYADETPEYMLGELVVTATDFGRRVQELILVLVQLEILLKNHYSNVQDALRDIPGVTISGMVILVKLYSSNSFNLKWQ